MVAPNHPSGRDQPESTELTSGRTLGRSFLFNLVAEGIPALTALICIPTLINILGKEQFGILALGWAVVGYFGIFDFGLGRALSKLIAEKLGSREFGEISTLIWTGLALMALLGLVAAAAAWFSTPIAVHHLASSSDVLQRETITVLHLLALTIPFVILGSAAVGVLTAYQRFDAVMWVRFPVGTWMFLGPVIAAMLSGSIIAVVLTLVLGRAVMLAIVGWQCFRCVPGLWPAGFDWALAKSLASFGGWVTVSNVISPIMVYMDRFLIAGMIGLTAVTYYVTPYEIAAKTQMLSIMLVTVLFPAFSTMLAFDRAKARRVFDLSNVVVLSVMLPVAVVIVAFSADGLTIWLGKDFASHSTLVLQVLIVGIMINSLALIPYALIQADGKPKITATLHVAELPIYLLVFWVVVRRFGVVGAAAAWTVRVTIDWLLLLAVASTRVESRRTPKFAGLVALSLVLIAIIEATSNTTMRLFALFAVPVAIVMCAWFFLLDRTDRQVLLDRLIQASQAVLGTRRA